jgi:Multicopper oxidase
MKDVLNTIINYKKQNNFPRLNSNPTIIDRVCFNFNAVDTNGTMTHPIHMHGTMFYVTELGSARSRANGRHREFPSPGPFTIKKDTVVVPSNGYARVRFNASNPGTQI